MSVPFAEYEVTSVPDGLGVQVRGGGAALILDPMRRQVVAREAVAAIFVQGEDERLRELGWRGVLSHGLDASHGWRATRIGAGPRLNGAWLQGAQPLRDGDQVEAAKGLVFTFRLRTDLEALHQLAQQRGWRPQADDFAVRDFLLEHMSSEGAARAAHHFSLRREHSKVPRDSGELHDAVKKRSVAALEALLRTGRDPNSLDGNGQPPLRHVLTYGVGFMLEDDTQCMVELLMAAGADPAVAAVGDTLMAEADSMVTSGLEANQAGALANLLGR